LIGQLHIGKAKEVIYIGMVTTRNHSLVHSLLKTYLLFLLANYKKAVIPGGKRQCRSKDGLALSKATGNTRHARERQLYITGQGSEKNLAKEAF